MYLNDFQRTNFYRSIGLDSRQYDMQVIRKTNESASRVFPVALNIDHPNFFKYLDQCAQINSLLENTHMKKINWMGKVLKKIPLYIKLGINLLKLYLINPIPSYKMNQTIR
jgi:magnesium-protoporphyrin IX monomethyl ester (oxidative) cyclase